MGNKKMLQDLFNEESFTWSEAYKTSFNSGKKYIFIGDTNHDNVSIETSFFSIANLKAIVDSGVKHVFLEIDPKHQKLIDDASHGILPNTDHHSPKVLLIAHATEYLYSEGVQVHCPDDRQNLNQETIDRYFKISKMFKNDPNIFINPKGLENNLPYSIAEAIKAVTKYKKELSELLKQREEDDLPLAKRISKLAKNEKSIIFFGSAHGNNLCKYLGADLCSRFDIYDNKKTANQKLSNKKHRLPNGIHTINTGKIYYTK